MPFIEGLSVVELDPTPAVAFAGRNLADLGAHVTIVEDAEGSSLRALPPFGPAGESLLFAYLAHGKQSRIASGSSRELDGADLVIHPYPQAKFEARTGWTPASGPAALAITPFGDDGPDGHSVPDIAVDAASGNLWLTGFPSHPPNAMYGYQPSYFAGLAATSVALALLLDPSRRQATVSAMEVQASVLEDAFLRLQLLGQEIDRQGNRWRNPSPFLDLYPTLDGATAISVYLEPQWESLCAILDHHEWRDDPRFQTWESRRSNGDEIEAAMRAWFAAKASAEAFDLLQAYRIPCAILMSPAELLADPQLVERHAFEPLALSRGTVAGKQAITMAPGLPWVSAVPGPEAGPPPVVGRSSPRSHPGQRVPLNLRSLRVLDFTHAWAGPWGARALADLGMDVIRVESGVRPDPTRLGATASESLSTAPMTERSIWFQQYSTNKRSISLEVTHPQGHEVLMRLVAASDIVIDNFSARVMPQLGLGFEALSAANPRIVQVRLTGYGGTGPLANTVAYGEPLESATGLVFLTRSGGRPVRSGIAYPDVVGGYHGAMAALAGIHYREATGRGVLIDLSERDATMRMAGEAFAEAALLGQSTLREDSADPCASPSGVYPAAGTDAWLAVLCRTDVAWAKFAGAIGLAAASEWSLEERRQARREVDEAIARWTHTRDGADAAAFLATIGVEAYPVVRVRDIIEGAAHRASGFVVPVEHPILGRLMLPSPPFTVDGARVPLRHAPLFGEHTDEVLREVAGLDDAEIDRLAAAGAIKVVPKLA